MMAKNKKRIVIIISIALLFGGFCAWLVWPASKPQVVQWAQYLIRSNLTTGKDSVKIRQILDTLLYNTSEAGKVKINEAYDPSAVNVYVIDGNNARVINDVEVNPMISNCEYIGNRVVLLDDAYLRAFMDRHKVDTGMPAWTITQDQESFLYWVIGHELGHLMSGQPGTHFEATSLDKFVSNATLQNRQELQADSISVRLVMPHRQKRIAEESMMLDVLNAEIDRKVGKVRTFGVGIIYDYTNKQVVKYAEQPTHPEFVIRLARMLEMSSKASADTGLQNLVGGFIKQLNRR